MADGRGRGGEKGVLLEGSGGESEQVEGWDATIEEVSSP